ncbi:shikimate kinase AroL [Maridesulfovibrio sp.]|uniref:shikimate kinase AroL n=1 Tax=Maridesulfovibrio sp. TaxID=2795000 RepID=UPI002A18DB82|nr:shikimate kinase AroL [Maridesulfovibrio sp.]
MPNIFLIGPRACGKTTAGRALAQKMKREFYDSDILIVERAGCEIARYVEKNGWDAFRDLEAAVLADLAAGDDAVISCGGGIVLREENREVLMAGYTVYIKADEEVLAARLMVDPKHGQRPSLTGKPLTEEIREVLEARESLYVSCSSLVADGAAPVDDVCDQISTHFESFDRGDK